MPESTGAWSSLARASWPVSGWRVTTNSEAAHQGRLPLFERMDKGYTKRRRSIPAKPARPLPISHRLDGSGMGFGASLSVTEMSLKLYSLSLSYPLKINVSLPVPTTVKVNSAVSLASYSDPTTMCHPTRLGSLCRYQGHHRSRH